MSSLHRQTAGQLPVQLSFTFEGRLISNLSVLKGSSLKVIALPFERQPREAALTTITQANGVYWRLARTF